MVEIIFTATDNEVGTMITLATTQKPLNYKFISLFNSSIP